MMSPKTFYSSSKVRNANSLCFDQFHCPSLGVKALASYDYVSRFHLHKQLLELYITCLKV